MTKSPKKIRKRSPLKSGDRPRHTVSEKAVEIEHADAPADDPFATFTEWASDADEKAYGKL